MSKKQSINTPYKFTDKTYRYLATVMGIPADKIDRGFNPELMKKYNIYQNDAKLLFYKYAELQECATRVLAESSNDEEREEVLSHMADFCIMIHDLSDEELNVFLVDAQKNAFRDMLNLEKHLRENRGKTYSNLDHLLKDKLKPYKNFSFHSRIPGGTKVEYRQIGTSFIYSMLGTLNDVDMGKDSAICVYEAKLRAGITPTEKERIFYDAESKRKKWIDKAISFEKEIKEQEDKSQKVDSKKTSTFDAV